MSAAPRRPAAIGPASDVLILRSGYATDMLWREAIEVALRHGRTGRSVGTDGQASPLAHGGGHDG